MDLGELAKWDLVLVDEHDSLELALKKMNDAGIHHIFVKDDKGPKYLVSQSDIVSYFIQSNEKEKALQHSMQNVPHSKFEAFAYDIDLGDAIKAMVDGVGDSIVIRSSDGDYGIVTQTDVMRVCARLLGQGRDESGITQAEITLANPLTQSLMKLFSDLGI